jgi:hypothetical protein
MAKGKNEKAKGMIGFAAPYFCNLPPPAKAPEDKCLLI